MAFWKFTGTSAEVFPSLGITAQPGYVYDFGASTPPAEALVKEGVAPAVSSKWVSDPGPATDFNLKDRQATDLLSNYAQRSVSNLPQIPRLPGVVVTDNNYAGGLFATTVNTVGTAREPRVVGVSSSQLRFVYTNFSTNPSGSWPDADGTTTITFNASIEYNGTIYRVTFGGRTTGTLDAGGILVSDPVCIDVLAGDTIWCRTFLASGTAYSTRSVRGGSGATGGFTSVTDLTAPGSGAISNSTAFIYGPALVIGVPAPSASKPLAVLIEGTSIERGTGDGNSGGDAAVTAIPAVSSGGYVMNALSGLAGMVNLSVGGDKATFFTAAAARVRRMAVAAGCTSSILAYGVNDLTGGRTAAQLQADLLSIASLNQRYGVAKNFIITLPPLATTSTDGFATVANQTVNANAAVRVTHNAWVRDGGPIDPTSLAPVAAGTANALRFGSTSHPITGYFEVGDTVESARDSGKWKAAGRVVSDAAITSGGGALTSTTAAFNSALIKNGGDLGTTVFITGAGAASANLVTYLSAVGGATSATTINNASTTVSGAVMAIGVKTIDGTHPSTDGHLLMKGAISVAALTSALTTA